MISNGENAAIRLRLSAGRMYLYQKYCFLLVKKTFCCAGLPPPPAGSFCRGFSFPSILQFCCCRLPLVPPRRALVRSSPHSSNNGAAKPPPAGSFP